MITIEIIAIMNILIEDMKEEIIKEEIKEETKEVDLEIVDNIIIIMVNIEEANSQDKTREIDINVK
jgi:hypothetical protein